MQGRLGGSLVRVQGVLTGMLLRVQDRLGFVHGERRPAGNQADTAGDEQDTGPSPGAYGFMQKEAREKCCDHVTESGGGQNESQVGPGERGEVSVKKAGETGHADDDPGIDKGGEDVGPVSEVDLADIVHAALEQHVARAVAAGDGKIDEDLFEFHAEIRWERALWRARLDRFIG